ncbi:TIGR03668 family PPOX class F420-dependent oxidoreductase [Tsukamurella sp. 8F]|uniref:TIGR03668 family PPOX class F420-dependent oxidoreductase n=1 Tax=unclassified Tsukamurella TaxID=2633480 RepID=UPI0023B8D3E8|nr:MULTISPECIES: TIGR03668 family PPOX class F420-dependent oxidoreductase [unclassified Tsukamurella]MDF0531506.1 TIGR03668 family PPOX class F420-dependent oxidoreductase [Tsukamurella sp. 8J]MDF0588750.1 TIGR03668 family PPOX class F420-dependent oxidoreductase [Tsukamurella sp. 8F]
MRLTAAEARTRFVGARVARLATVSLGGAPHLVPITFAADGDGVAFAVDHKPKRTARLQRLRNIAAEPHVCLLVDVYTDDWNHLWWARADGEAHTVEGESRAAWVDRLRARYPQYQENPPEGPVVEIAVTRWSGWSAS